MRSEGLNYRQPRDGKECRFVIIVDGPSGIIFITDDNDKTMVFPSSRAARRQMEGHLLENAFPWFVIRAERFHELDEDA